jgi:UDP-GlcNAc:undecaprenyl-phosphate GlcNAc-1-phosphate transferase
MSDASSAPEGLSSGQTILFALLIGVSLGSVGLLGLALIVWLSHQWFGVDRSSKHGISVRNSSRLGGLAIALFLLMVWGLSFLKRATGFDFVLVVSLDGFPAFLWPVLLIGLVGLADDIGVELKPAYRLSVMLAIGLVFFLINPEALPNQLLEFLNIESNWGIFAFSAASSVLLAGFVNAANISDGANGLLAGLCIAFFWVAWQLQRDEWSFYLLVILLCFWLINGLTGRIMLGDLGAYFLGAWVVFVAFNLFDECGVSPFFLASLLSYPCVELLRVMVVRKSRGQSLFSADNTHLHNLLNAKLRASLRGNTLPNSLTGILIVLIATLPAILIFNLGLESDTLINLGVFSLQAIIFLFLWAWLNEG